VEYESNGDYNGFCLCHMYFLFESYFSLITPQDASQALILVLIQ